MLCWTFHRFGSGKKNTLPEWTDQTAEVKDGFLVLVCYLFLENGPKTFFFCITIMQKVTVEQKSFCFKIQIEKLIKNWLSRQMTGPHSLSLACTPTTQTHTQLHMKAQKLSSSRSSPATVAEGATTGARDGPLQSENSIIRSRRGSQWELAKVGEKHNSEPCKWMTYQHVHNIESRGLKVPPTAEEIFVTLLLSQVPKQWVRSGLSFFLFFIQSMSWQEVCPLGLWPRQLTP